MLEPDQQKSKPQPKTEVSRGGIGQPPRRTAVGLGSEGEFEGEESGPTVTLNWWQHLMTKAMMFLLNVDPKTDKDNN